MLLVFLGRKPKDSPLRNTRNTVRKVDLRISDPTMCKMYGRIAVPLSVAQT